MAPGRRKGRATAAAAAAARQQWKVGDLVLAKMKGFPAWPATISEPQKWGYSSDRKKLLVYFFGTKQIAFCNHADVEAFTEEKKKTLLIKRQGKGGDFVRAVDEIIESFENVKRQKHDVELNSGDEGVEQSVGNLEGSSVKSLTESPKSAPRLTSNDQSETCHASIRSNSSCSVGEVSVPLMEDVAIQNMDTISEQPTQKVSILDQLRQGPLTTLAYLRKRSREAPLNNGVVRASSLRRCRSSIRADSFKRQRPEMLVSESGKCSDNLILDEAQDGSAIKNRPIRKTPDVDNSSHDSGALVPNGNCRDIGTEIADATPSNKGCTLESCCKDEEFMADFMAKVINTNGVLDIQTKTVILKKKRKPNKKRFTRGTTSYANFNKETIFMSELNKTPASPNSCQKINERFQKTEGDEHLPLVKRARARMGKLSVEKQLDEVVCLGEKSEKVPLVSQFDQVNTSSSSGDDLTADRTVVGAINAFDKLSKDNNPVREIDPVLWKVKKYSLRCGALDVEAALPPSKRLHRALEAMSANANEARNDCSDGPRAMDVLSNRCSPKTDGQQISSDNNSSSPSEPHSMRSFDGIEVHDCASGLSLNLPSRDREAPTEASAEEKPGNMCLGNSRSPQQENSREKSMNTKICDDPSNSKTVETELHRQSPELCSSNGIDKHVTIACSQSTLDQLYSQVSEGSTKDILQVDKEFSVDVIIGKGANLQEDKLDADNETAKPNVWNLDCGIKCKEDNNILSPSATTSILSDRDGCSTSLVSATTKPLKFQSDENTGSKDMQEVTVELKHKSTPKELGFSPDSTPMKMLIAAALAKRLLSRSTSLSDNAVNDKYCAPDGVLCPSPFYKEVSSEQVSPRKPMVNHTPAAVGRSNSVETSSRSPDVIPRSKNSIHLMDTDEVRSGSTLTHKQNLNRLVGQAEATAARKSFETMLCTLSRTKESIGRATRLAIDCAKYGLSGEVVQILLQHLERESSLHRKVDQFFLVDSITQCSRGQKGVAGDVYPSLFQSVLPRLLSAAAPPGNSAWENRRQCLKVLRLWLERRTLPESIVRHHIRELESFNEASFSTGSSRRPSRNERALNDPVREMEGMLVDEYGSNTSFHLPGLLGSHVLEDEEEGSANDEKSFEAVTPEVEAEIRDEAETTLNSTTEKHRHILEDVDGELEMEDVAPTCEVEMSSTYHAAADSAHASHYQYQHTSPPFAPPLPEENPPSPPPLPSSPPPVVPCHFPSHVLPSPSTAVIQNLSDDANSHLYRGTHNMQGPFSGPRCSTPNMNSIPSDTVSYYAPGCGDFQKQTLLPVSSLSSSGSYGNILGSLPSMHTGNDILPLGSGQLPSKGYHLQPPPPTVSNQFSYVQTDQQKQMQFLGHDVQGGNFHCDRDSRGPVQHEIGERCRFSAAAHAGPTLSEKVEVLPNSVVYKGPPSEASHPSHSWSIPPRASNYQYSIAASRPPMENQNSRMAGVPGYWRPR